jgi:hypothetical protein
VRGKLLLYFIWDELGLYNGACIIFLHSKQVLANDDSMKEKNQLKENILNSDSCFSILSIHVS